MTLLHSTDNNISDILYEAAVRFVTRVRNGKVIRRAKVKSVKRKGFKIRGSRLVRETSAEQRNRRRAAIKAARKRRSKRSQINRKRARSLLKRKRMHIPNRKKK